MIEIDVAANGLVFRALTAGTPGRPVCLCLHGFPDHNRTWRHLLPLLSDAGFYAVAPNLRGYDPSSIPADGRYHLAALARDALAILDALGAERAVLIGHDWGADLAHAAAILAPARVAKLVTMASPHPLLELASRSYEQLKHFWYMFYFLRPEAEEFVAADDFVFIDRLWKDWSPGFTLEAAERAALKSRLRRPGVLRAALSYYRAAFDDSDANANVIAETSRISALPIPVHTLYIQGRNDGCVIQETIDAMGGGYAGGVDKLIVEGAGHFVHLERSDVVNAAILQYLT